MDSRLFYYLKEVDIQTFLKDSEIDFLNMVLDVWCNEFGQQQIRSFFKTFEINEDLFKGEFLKAIQNNNLKVIYRFFRNGILYYFNYQEIFNLLSNPKTQLLKKVILSVLKFNNANDYDWTLFYFNDEIDDIIIQQIKEILKSDDLEDIQFFQGIYSQLKSQSE